MGKSTISMAIFNSYFDITRGYSWWLQPNIGQLGNSLQLTQLTQLTALARITMPTISWKTSERPELAVKTSKAMDCLARLISSCKNTSWILIPEIYPNCAFSRGIGLSFPGTAVHAFFESRFGLMRLLWTIHRKIHGRHGESQLAGWMRHKVGPTRTKYYSILSPIICRCLAPCLHRKIQLIQLIRLPSSPPGTSAPGSVCVERNHPPRTWTWSLSIQQLVLTNRFNHGLTMFNLLKPLENSDHSHHVKVIQGAWWIFSKLQMNDFHL